jgi:hypothetical protein
MTRIPRAPLIGLVLLGLAVALAVPGLGQGGAKPAAAQPLTPHYECYDIPGAAPTPAAVVKLETQFGVENEVAVGPATKLCLPAAKNVPPIPNVPHLKCYNIDGERAPHGVQLTTQFGLQYEVELGKAKLLCAPAIKTVVSPPEPTPTPGPLPTVPHYKCYEILSGANDPGTVMLQTQFGTEPVVNVGLSKYLCLSAIKTKLPGGTPEGTLTEPDLECYTLAQPPLVPPRVVELMSQFGLELPLTVGQATMLCTPAIKGPPPVGGIAEMPGLAGGAGDQAAAPDNGSGWSSAGYAALAGGLAAAAVVLSAGVWYARRRSSRS